MIETLAYTGFAGLFGVLLIIAAIGDIERLIIPNWIPASIVGLFAGQYLLAQAIGTTDISDNFIPSLVTGLGTLAVFTVLFALGQMGGGDVKLIAASSLFAGPDHVFAFVVVTAISGGFLAIFQIFRGARIGKSIRPLAGSIAGTIGEVSQSRTQGRTTRALPYGVAIAAGGLFVVEKMIRASL